MISMHDIKGHSMGKKSLEVVTESMFYVLMAFTGGQKCGIDVAEFITNKTRGRLPIGPATLYTILGRFEAEGLIREVQVEGRKRTYCLTTKGRSIYDEEIVRLQQCLADAQEVENHG